MKISLQAVQLVLLASFASVSWAQLSLCANHPATKDIANFQPVLLQKWDQPSSDGGSTSRAGFNVDYLPRAETIHYQGEAAYAPHATLKGLDLIVKEDDARVMLFRDHKPTFTFHRPATVFMLATADKERAEGKVPTYPGWESVGWYHKKGTEETVDIGVRLIRTIPLDETVFVFSKQTDENNAIELPSLEFVYDRKARHLVNRRARDNHIIWLVGEKDGSPSKTPLVPKDVPAIVPGQTCPQELHDLWKLPASSSSSFPDFATDPDLKDQSFATWHPIFDPCYYCSYDHEHGSDASSLIGPEFAPHYTYTAWKNHRQDESVPGFKSFVFRYRKYMAIYDIHVQTSKPRRFQTPIHTGTFTLVDVKTTPDKPKLILKLTRKLDFGPLEFFTNNDSDFLPVNATESALVPRGKFGRSRGVNTNATNVYERWDTKPMCALDSGSQTIFRVRITNTPTALGNFSDGQDPSLFTGIPLYRDMREFPKTHQVGMRRQLVVMNVTIGTANCASEIDGFVAVRTNNPNGVFYTDPMGAKAFTEPAKDRMWQYIDPSFKSLKFDGRVHLRMDSQWDTLYTTNEFNFPDNIRTTDALDPDVN